jgi:hypothetical protein
MPGKALIACSTSSSSHPSSPGVDLVLRLPAESHPVRPERPPPVEQMPHDRDREPIVEATQLREARVSRPHQLRRALNDRELHAGGLHRSDRPDPAGLRHVQVADAIGYQRRHATSLGRRTRPSRPKQAQATDWRVRAGQVCLVARGWSRLRLPTADADVAQLVEHFTRNQLARGLVAGGGSARESPKTAQMLGISMAESLAISGREEPRLATATAFLQPGCSQNSSRAPGAMRAAAALAGTELKRHGALGRGSLPACGRASFSSTRRPYDHRCAAPRRRM